jgi:hypothetical protein
MTEQELNTVDVLNDLYAAETGSILPRLPELSLHASWGMAEEAELVRRLGEQSQEHRRRLIREIEAAGGSVRPASGSIEAASLHYVSFEAVRPRVIRALEQLRQVYAHAAARTPLTPAATALITRHTADCAHAVENLQPTTPART